MTCMSVKTDMATFMCHDQCDGYCGGECKLVLPILEKKLKNGAPLDWPLAEKSSLWKSYEKKLVVEALSQVPDQFMGPLTWSIYRMKKSLNNPNPATNANTDSRAIVLYDTAFGGRYSLSRVVVHELAHIYFQKLSVKKMKTYLVSMNWFSISEAGSKKETWISRKDGFVEEDGRDSPEEDFANNVEYYLFDPQKLKSITPYAHDWIQNNTNDLKLKEGCKYEK